MSQEIENVEEVEVKEEGVNAGSGEVAKPVVENTTTKATEPEVKGFLDDEEEDEKDYNRILPRALSGGKGIPVTLHKLPVLTAVEKKDKTKFMAIRWEFYEAANDAYHKQNMALPIEDVDVVSETDKSIQATNKSVFMHLVGAFVDFKGIPALNWLDFAEKALAKFTPAMIGTKAEIKVVYSENNKFIQFPRFPNFISTAKKKKQLETDPNNKYDKVEKTKLASSGGMSTESDIDSDKMNDLV